MSETKFDSRPLYEAREAVVRRAAFPLLGALCVGALVVVIAAIGAERSHAAVATPGAVAGIVDIDTNLKYEGEEAAGTGMVLTSSGEVLTNNHVIRGATTIRVTDLDNGHTYAATVVGYDVSADVAVLQITHASGLQTIPLGNSATLKVGEAITAIGNAGGVGGTPSQAAGTVTALGKAITATEDGGGDAERLTGLLETNAAIQPGDSGGPVVNSANQVVGMDTAASEGFTFQSDVAATQGFAIPINRATALASEIEAGHATTTIHIGTTPFLGVQVETVAEAEAGGAFFGVQFPASKGLAVLNIISASPAAKAGLADNDVITTLDGHALTTTNQLTDLLINVAPGQTIHLGWVGQTGASHTTTVRLANGPAQ